MLHLWQQPCLIIELPERGIIDITLVEPQLNGGGAPHGYLAQRAGSMPVMAIRSDTTGLVLRPMGMLADTWAYCMPARNPCWRASTSVSVIVWVSVPLVAIVVLDTLQRGLTGVSHINQHGVGSRAYRLKSSRRHHRHHQWYSEQEGTLYPSSDR